MEEIKKAIIPIAGLGTRFLPLSKVVPKELLPLVDVPMIHHIVEEVKHSGIREVIFVCKPERNKLVLDYFKRAPHLEKILKERKKENLLRELKKLDDLFGDISFTYVLQKRPLGDGHAVLQAANLIHDEPVACLFADDIIVSKTPALLQLLKVFKTCQKPVLALYGIAQERVSSYGIVGTDKIASRLHKIRKIVEKPQASAAPSNLAIVGKYILTPDVFDYLGKARLKGKKEIILAEVFEKMIGEGKLIYGYEVQGTWLECGTKLEWLKSHLYLSLQDSHYGPELKKFLKEARVL